MTCLCCVNRSLRSSPVCPKADSRFATEKIAHGRLNKFFKESTLLQQEFIKDNKMTVEQYLKSVDKDLTATDFKRHSLTI